MRRIGLEFPHSAHVKSFLPEVYRCYNVTGEVQSPKGEGAHYCPDDNRYTCGTNRDS